MNDGLRELNRKFAESQRNAETCSIGNDGGCYAPKYGEIPTEAGLPIAVCAYHYIKLQWPEDQREKQAFNEVGVSFQELKKKWREYNEKIKAENSEGDTE